MSEKYEHYITKNIKAFYRRRLFSPLIYIGLLIALWFIFSLSNLLIPQSVTNGTALYKIYNSGNHYLQASFTDLTFTGYTRESYGRTNGYYYYGKWGEETVIVLINPIVCEQGLPHIDAIRMNTRIVRADETYEAMLGELASDMDWTKEGILNQMPGYYFSQPACHTYSTTVLFACYLGTLIYAMLTVIKYLLYIFAPVLAPACRNLVVFGNPKQMLAEAEEELATLPQLATEDMFITEHYFIMTSPVGNAFVPIEDILWIYKHSTLHKVLGYHFSISYTLHVTGKKRFYFHCPKNIKSDIDGIMDYLAEANHDILVGFSEENRIKVAQRQKKTFRLEKITALFRKK